MLNTYLGKIYVTLKPTVNDPQGKTILGGLKSLGYESVLDGRAGKYIQVKVISDHHNKASKLVEEMCLELLTNTVIENYSYDIEEISSD